MSSTHLGTPFVPLAPPVPPDPYPAEQRARRDRFAAAALTGLLASENWRNLHFKERLDITALAANLGQFQLVACDRMAAELAAMGPR